MFKLVENNEAILFEEVASEWNPHQDLQDLYEGPNAIGDQFGAGTYYIFDNGIIGEELHLHTHLHQPQLHIDPAHFALGPLTVLEEVTTTVAYAYHV